MPALAGLCVLLDGLAPAAAQGQTAAAPSPPAPRTFPTYPVEGPYGPYSDLIPGSGQLSSANTPYGQLPSSPYPYAPSPAYPAYPAVPSYTPPNLLPPPPAPPAYSQYPAPQPPTPPQYAQPAPVAPPRRSAAAENVAAADEGASSGDNKYPNPLLGIITQAEIGIARHDAGVFGRNKEPGADIDGEIRFLPIEWLDFMASPRPHIGFHANTSGATNQIFTGITWEFWFWDDFFVNPSFGLSFNDDKYLDSGPTNSKQLGSHVLFREAVELGWNFSGPHSVSILLDHVSHGRMLARENEGMDTLGVRYGYRF